MAFTPYRKLHGETPAFDHRYLMTDNEGCTLGEALVLSSGRLTKCGATTTPQFIAQKTIAAAASSTEYVPLIPVVPHQEFETTFTGDGSSLVVGDLVTINSDGLNVTATEASGVFTLTYLAALTTGSVCRGRFASA